MNVATHGNALEVVDDDEVHVPEVVGGGQRADFAARIRERWQESVTAILDVGRLLTEAKAALPGEFEAMVEQDLPFGPRTARMLMAVAAHPLLTDRNHGSALPPSWRTLYELTRLPEPVLIQALTDGTITPETERQDVRSLLERGRLTREPGPLPPGQYAVLYADPPWEYEHHKSDSRAIERHYPTMPLDEIKALPVAGISAPDSVLFLWATSPKLAEAQEVIEAWGFTYRTCMVWVKDKIGMGYYVRQRHELLLIAVKGDLPTPLPAARPDSVIEAPRGAHSVKPDGAYWRIETMYPGLPRVELFARTPRQGWDSWGNEVPAMMAEPA